MKCLICGEEFSPVGSHLRLRHNMTSKEYYDDFIRKEKEGYCLECGKETSFRGFKNGYLQFCSSKCSANSKSTQSKREQTLIKKYGVSHQMRCSEVKRKLENTNIQRYGSKSPFSNEDIKNKIKQTNLLKYGVENPSQSKLIKEKIKDTFLNKYGVEKVSDILSGRNKTKQKRLERIEEIRKEGYSLLWSTIEEYGQSWYRTLDYPRIRKYGCYFIDNEYIENTIKKYTEENYSRSVFEKEILDYIKLIYKGKITRNDRTIIKPKELDIYLPEIKIAIECNGIWWHSTEHGISQNYHLEKTEACESRGVQLIQINEWEWKRRKLFWKDLLLKIIDQQYKFDFRDVSRSIVLDRSIYNLSNILVDLSKQYISYLPPKPMYYYQQHKTNRKKSKNYLEVYNSGYIKIESLKRKRTLSKL